MAGGVGSIPDMQVGKAAHGIPNYRYFMWPVLCAVRDLGGSGRISEIVEHVVEGYTEEQQAKRHPSSGGLILEGRLGFARSALKLIGALDNSERGVWVLTGAGRELESEEQVLQLHKEAEKERLARRKAEAEAGLEDDDPDEDVDDPDAWKGLLLKRLLNMSPDGFERLAQRLLREAGFRNVEVLGKSGDGGIDGVGVYRVSLISFPIYFQCKRYQGSVSVSKVRDFRGAMVGRGEKGLLITTGSFTRGSREEAARDGAPPIDLVDGDELCNLLKEYGLGVRVTTRTVEDIEVTPDFFDQF